MRNRINSLEAWLSGSGRGSRLWHRACLSKRRIRWSTPLQGVGTEHDRYEAL